MAKTKISEFDSVPANNTDIDSINIAEGCAPSGINNAIRELMSQLKDQQTGAAGDNFTVGGNLAVTGTSVHTGATTFTGAVVMSTALPVASGGTGASTSANARTNLSAAGSGANSDITSITGLTTALTVAQGGTGAATHTSKGVLIGNGTSAITTVSPGTSNNVLTSDGTSWTSATGAYPLTSMTSQASTSGTNIDFTSIPSWVKRVTVMFNGVSTNGSSAPQIQIGDSGGVETTGYLAGGGIGQQSQNWVLTAFTNGFPVAAANGAWGDTALFHGSMTITNLTGNVWVANAVFYNSTATVQIYLTAGSKTLSSTLDRVRITTDNGTDTFDAGTINILYE
jgi:hypothetical protein